MAKRKIPTYIFNPGNGLLDNEYPSAYELIHQNKEFIKDEAIEYIAGRIVSDTAEDDNPFASALLTANRGFIIEETKAYVQSRIASDTLAYTPTTATYDPATGVLVATIGTHSLQVGDKVKVKEEGFTWTCDLDGGATTHSYPRAVSPTGSDAAYSKAIEITAIGAETITINVGAAGPTAVNSVHTFQSALTNAISQPFYSYTYNQNTWDDLLEELVDSIAYDIRYGGNFKTVQFMNNQWDDQIPLISGDRVAEQETFEEVKNIITNFVLSNTNKSPVLQTESVQAILGDPAEPATVSKIQNLLNDLKIVVSKGLEFLPTEAYGYTFANYTYNSSKCERDVGYVIDAYLNDLKYSGNKLTYETAALYWDQDVPQVDGSRYPEVETHQFIEDLINNYLLQNTEFPSAQSPVRTTQLINFEYTAEVSATSTITTLRTLLTNVILNGLSALPEKQNGLGTIRFQGRYNEEDILLITNVTKGEIVYSFNDPQKIAEVEFLKDSDIGADIEKEFASFDQTADTITSVKLFFNTSTHSSDDRLQIFVEEKEIRTRPFDFGTDAIERNRVAASQSMLDADFEYGLQPTKWQAIGMQRGYPSLYEVPGTELSVLTVITDGSITTDGIGSSIITVTTSGPHNLEPGTPVTIKGLGGTALGIGRAEGSFIVTTAPTATTFTYFAKSKVGTNGDVLSTTYTQLRKAGFYTGASVGSPTFTVASQGSAGTFNTALIHPSGSDTITVDGDLPELGAPIVDATGAVPTGAQVSAVVGDGTGVQITAETAEDIPDGVSEFDVIDTSGIIVGMAIDRGNNEAAVVTQVAGQTVTLDREITVSRPGSNVTYQNLSATLLAAALGSGATFNVVRSAGSYTTTLNAAGTEYEVNDVLLIAGVLVGGETPANDIEIRVTSVGAGGEIVTFTETGTASPADGIFTGASGLLTSGIGTGAVFDIEKLDNSYNSSIAALNSIAIGQVPAPIGLGATFDISASNGVYTPTILNAGADYTVGDQILIDGITLSGQSGTNDLIITVDSVDVTGAITNVTANGTAAAEDSTYTTFTPVYAGASGTDAQFIIIQNGTTYTVQITNAGTGYAATETFVVTGDQLGGGSPANDATITINTIGASGDITDASISGTALDQYTSNNINGTNVFGSGAEFIITESAGSYVANISNGGEYFNVSDEILIPGASLLGENLTNDLTLTVTAVDSNGAITSVTTAGTPADLRGSNYTVNDQILILGSRLGGEDAVNDATITVTSVGASGEITGTSITGTATDGFTNYENISYATAGNGINASLDVTRFGTTYSVSITGGGSNFVQGDQLSVLGTALGGTSPANDLIITVSTVDGGGAITDTSVSGTAINQELLTAIEGSNVAGTGASFDISNTSTVYSLDAISNPGEAYKVNDAIVITGDQLGGTTPANDLTITVTAVSGTGGITTVSISGTGGDGSGTYTSVNAIYAEFNGSLATFDVTRTLSVYTVGPTDGGSGYRPGNTLIIAGDQLGGVSPDNDAQIVIEEVDVSGGVTNASVSGTVTAAASLQFYSTVTMTEVLVDELANNTNIAFEQLATIQVNFETGHGIVPGASVIATISSDDGLGNNHLLAAGSFIATEIASPTQLSYQARAAGTIDTATDDLSGAIYLRPDSFFVHRPFDGGVQLGTGGPQHGSQAIRQSKNYIRYQSGKGIMYTTGALFAPSYDILTITSTGTVIGSTITVEIDDADHGLQVGGVIRLIGVETAGYNGDYVVSDVVNERTFKILATTQLGSRVPRLGPTCQASVREWHGSTVRAGAFDEQNGIFWEYDGTNLSVVQRTSTFQLAGLATVAPDSNLVTGSSTRFQDQVKAGDRIVIRGMTHVVSSVVSNTEMTITPDYRGVNTAVNAKLCLISDKRVKQNDYNLDKLDGTGQSAYDVDISKMQMIGIQYSWYGAGFIDFMIRGADGNFIFCHRMRNSNVNTEAFMRSGNLPVRYEVTNEGSNGKLAESINATQTTITLEDADFFPANGATLYIDNEIITYTGKTGNTLTGCTRAASLINFQAGAQRQYTAGPAVSHTRRTGVVIISNTITPIISHWGSAFITDGGFDSDRGYIFAYAAQGIEVSTERNTAFLLRLAPSVSNAITGDLGDRDLLNRAQLLLNGIEVTSDPLAAADSGGIIIEGVLNPSNYPTDPNSVGWSPLNTQAQGGQPSFAQVAAGAAIDWGTGAAVLSPADSVLTAPQQTGIDFLYIQRNRNDFFVRNDDNYNLPIGSIMTGDNVDGDPMFDNNTVITGVQKDWGFLYDRSVGFSVRADRYVISRRVDQNPNDNQAGASSGVTGEVSLPLSEGRTSKVLFTESIFLATGATTGTPVDSTDVNFPAGTQVNSIETIELGGTSYVLVEFNQSASNFTAGDTVVFNLTGAAFAQPGETIFRFIAVPGERSELDLSPIKELTNTSLGGRGTFPNGPDVLAINIRKTSGESINGNVILKWGEAQA